MKLIPALVYIDIVSVICKLLLFVVHQFVANLSQILLKLFIFTCGIVLNYNRSKPQHNLAQSHTGILYSDLRCRPLNLVKNFTNLGVSV